MAFQLVPAHFGRISHPKSATRQKVEMGSVWGHNSGEQ